MNHHIHIMNNEGISFLEDASVHLTVTSPPYVTTEFKKGQDFDYDGFMDHFRIVCRELLRITVPGGRFALNVADMITKYRYDDEDIMARAPFGSDTLQVAMGEGWRLLERFIWDKGFTRNFGGPLLGSYPYPLTIYNNNYFEYIYILRKPGKRRVAQTVREENRMTLDEWRSWSQQWWRVESISERINYHRAVFPIEIPHRLIRMYSYKGDMICDPYMGTGATMIAAELSGRNSVGIEIDQKCDRLIARRIEDESKNYDLGDISYQILRDKDRGKS